MKLTAADKKKLPASKFLDPAHRKYPVPDKKHISTALAYAKGARGAPERPDIAAKARALLNKRGK